MSAALTAPPHVIAAVRHWSRMPLGIQLCHAGRKGSSREPWNGGALIPAESGGWPLLALSRHLLTLEHLRDKLAGLHHAA